MSTTSNAAEPASPPAYYPWIDSLKGFGIFLVVLGHVSTTTAVTQTLFAFHMPLFFFISGLLFHHHSLQTTLIRKTRRLLIPYLFFALITWGYWVVIERHIRHQSNPIMHALGNIIIARGGTDNYPYNAPLWFLPCLFITELLFALGYASLFEKIGEHSKKPRISATIIAILALAGLLLGYACSRSLLPTRLPLTLDIVPVGFTFYALGFLCKPMLLQNIQSLPQTVSRHQTDSDNRCSRCNSHRYIPRKTLDAIISVILFTTVWLIAQATKLTVDLNNMTISNSWWLLIASATGITASVLFAHAIDCTPIRYLGTISLTAMCIHEPVKRILIRFNGIITRLGDDSVRQNIFCSLVITLITLLVAAAVYEILKRILPVSVGLTYRS